MTIQKLLLLLAAVLFTGMAAPCSANGTRGEVLLDDDVITLGDVFEGMGEQGGKTIAEAPEPGRKITYDVSALAQIARAYQVAWKPKGNYERVTLTRASQVITPAMIKEKVVAALSDQIENKDLDVVLDNQGMEVHRASKSIFDVTVADLAYDPVRHRFTGNLVVTPKDNPAQKADVFSLAGRAMPMTRVGMLMNAVAAGTVVTEADLEWSRIPLDKAGADAVSDIKQLQDMEIRRNMNAQTILRLRDFVKARMVAKGSVVMMHVDTPTMSLTAQGRALSDGAIGDTIRVTNTQSSRTIDAVITGKDKVSVMPAMAPAAVASR